MVNDYKNSFLSDILIICTLTAITIAQPIYASLSQSATFFVAHNVTLWHILLFILSVSVVVPVVIISILYILRRTNSKLYSVFYTLCIFILAALFSLITLNKLIDINPYFIFGLSAILGLVITYLFHRVQAVREITAFGSFSFVAIPLLFIFFSDVSSLVFKGKVKSEQSSVTSTTPVVLVVLDEFSPLGLLDEDQKIDTIRFPNFAEFADDATWFPNAASVHIATTRAVPSILSSVYPAKGAGLPTFQAFPDNVFTMLGSNYTFNAVESFTALCPKEYCQSELNNNDFELSAFKADMIIIAKHLVYPKSLAEKHLPSLDIGWRDFGVAEDISSSDEEDPDVALRQKRGKLRDTDKVSIFRNWIQNISAEDSTFDFMHTILPHTPYVYLPDGNKYNKRITGPIRKSETNAKYVYHRYLMQLGTTDMLVGELMTHLKKIDKYDRSLIIIVADHGLTFYNIGEHKRSITPQSGSSIHIPLLVKMPHQKAAETNEDFILNIDVVPTIADVLGVKPAWPVDGVSILDENRPNRQEVSIYHRGKALTASKDMIFDYEAIPDRIKNFGQHASLENLSMGMGTENANLIGMSLKDLGARINIKKAKKRSPVLKMPLEDFKDIKIPGDLPALVSGQLPLSMTQDPSMSLAIALNGKITGIVDTEIKRERHHEFAMLIPPAYFKKGKNKIRVFRVENRKNKQTLTEILVRNK